MASGGKISLVEGHPYRHDWYTWTDYVHTRNSRKVLTVIKRVYDCSACNTHWVWIINVVKWERISAYHKYDKRQKIVRIGKSTWLKREIIKTCNNEEIRKELARQKG